MISLVDGLEEWQETLVNCLLNRFAMGRGLVRVFDPNLIGWLGGGWVFLFDRERIRSQNFLRLVLGVAEVMCLLQVSVDSRLVVRLICWFIFEISLLEGSVERSWSRWCVRLRISGVRFALKSLR